MLSRILEAILFAADGPLTIEQIAVALPDRGPEEIAEALTALRDRYEQEERGWRLGYLAGGWQLLSHPDLYPYVERLLEGKRRARLSRAALETLAVVAYRQPITRGELEGMRGVDSGGVLHTLLERDLITICGRSKAIGRPLIYATTDRFLEHFGLASLADLPRLEELEALTASEEVRAQIERELARRLESAMSGTGGNGGDDGGAQAGQVLGDLAQAGREKPHSVTWDEEGPIRMDAVRGG